MASGVLLPLLLMQGLAAAEIPRSSGFPPFLNGRPFQSVSGPEDSTGTLLEMLSGVTATGKGVIVGIIDSGIDWRHPDFRDPADSLRSRILAIWDMDSELGPSPAGFDFGREWPRDEIEAALRGEGTGPPRDTSGGVLSGHGTYVAGIAAGNGNADPRYRGMAPEAKIVVVSAFSQQFSLMGAIRYISGVAEREGCPVVVNTSIVTGPGTEQEGWEQHLRETPGRAMVASAGNAGDSGHCRFDLAETESYTIYRAEEEEVASWEEGLGSELWLSVYHQGPGEAWLGIGLSADKLVWRSLRELADKEVDPLAPPYFTLDSLATETSGTRAYLGWVAYSEEEEIGASIIISDRMREPADWIVAARGSGVLHVWTHSAQPQGVREAPEDPQFRPFDNRYGIVYPSSSAEVVSVGAFANRDLDFRPGNYDDLAVGDLLPFSSRGPALDGLLKPDLVAPGVLTAARSGDSTRYRTEAGTSASAPVVAGAVALYFERFPQATNREVWRALTETATSDQFTGETPNLDWGYGKLDVAALLQEPPTVVAADAGEVRPAGFSLEQNYPNPFNSRTSISYRLPGPSTAELTLYDLLGRPVRRLVSENQEAGTHQASWDGMDDDGRAAASGVYLYRLKAGSRQLSRRLLLVR